MKGETRLPVLFSLSSLSLLFVTSLFYNGPGHSLHWLTVVALLMFAWLVVGIYRLEVFAFLVVLGWLPMLACLYAGWLFVEPFFSTYPYASSTAAWQLAILPLTLIGWLLWQWRNASEQWQPAWTIVQIIGVVLAIWGTVDYLVLKTRSHGPLIDANAYAALINLILVPITFSYLKGCRSGFFGPRSQLVVIGLLALAQSTSMSRGALLAFLATFPLQIWFSRTNPELRSRLVKLLVVLLVAYLPVKIAPLQPNRGIEAMLLGSSEVLEHDPNIHARFLIWNSTWEIIKNSNLLIGTGLGTFKPYYAAYRNPAEIFTSGNLAHSDYLQALQEGGLIQAAFLFMLTVFAPVWLLSRFQSPEANEPACKVAPGLAIALLCASLHALVNFVHYVLPITLLTGLYLARAWAEVQPNLSSQLPRPTQIKPSFLKGLSVFLLVVPLSIIILDGAIFMLFSRDDSILTRLAPRDRLVLLNAAIALRPANPIPRVSLIQQLINAAEGSESSENKAEFLMRAEQEGTLLLASAPSLASAHFFLGKVRALRGTTNDLIHAREELEHAVKLVPASTGMRLELVKVYQELGQDAEAGRAISEAEQWVMLEPDYRSLARFAKEAHVIAVNQRNDDGANFWLWVQERIAESGLLADNSDKHGRMPAFKGR